MPPLKETIIYITRDIERALGIPPSANYIVISNRTPYGELVAKQYPNFVTLIESGGDESAGTGDLIKSPQTAEVFSRLAESGGAKAYALVFKNTARIEPLAQERGWTILNPQAATSEKIENKITQISWLGELARYLPEHRIEFMKNIHWQNRPFILQWAHGHTGTGTILIKNGETLAELKAKFPERRSRVSAYIEGPSFTVNVVVSPEKILISSPSYQITGLKPMTDSRFATIGNDWGLAAKTLTQKDKEWIGDLALEAGVKMQKEYWRGLFGIDIVRDAATGKLFLIEINARQPASTTFESHLQEKERLEGALGLTTFEAHILALLGEPLTKSLIPIHDGAQVIQRVTENVKTISSDMIGALELDGFNTIPYENLALNADLLRIQSKKSIMSADGEFSDIGKRIVSNLKNGI